MHTCKNKLIKLMIAVLVTVASLLTFYVFIAPGSKGTDKKTLKNSAIGGNNIIETKDDISIDKAVSQNNPIELTLPKPHSKNIELSEDVSQSVADLPLPEMNDEYVDAIIKIPGHPWQRERCENIRGETLEQAIENFANFDDQHLAQTSISGLAAIITDARFQNIVVTRLARVRKVMEEGQIDSEKVIPLLQEAFQNAIKQWPETLLERRRAHKVMDKQEKGFILSEPGLYEKYHAQALAATYLLAELGSHDSLPLMLKCYELHDYEKHNFSPVPPGTTLYAMHRLVLSFPDKQLSSQSRDIRENYLQLANDLPVPEEITVARSWYSNYDESDPRIVMLDPQKKTLLKEPTMKMVIYPSVFTDGTEISVWDGEISEKTKLLFEELKKIIEATYPENPENPEN